MNKISNNILSIIINKNDYYGKISLLLELETVTHKQKVQFALYCTEDLEKYYDVKKYPKVYKTRQKCLELLGSWLIDETSVTTKQLQDAAYAANAASAAYAADAAYAANAATNAAYAVNAAYAAASAANAAAYAAAYAAANAATNFDKIRESKTKELYLYLLKLIGCDNKLLELCIG